MVRAEAVIPGSAPADSVLPVRQTSDVICDSEVCVAPMTAVGKGIRAGTGIAARKKKRKRFRKGYRNAQRGMDIS